MTLEYVPLEWRGIVKFLLFSGAVLGVAGGTFATVRRIAGESARQEIGVVRLETREYQAAQVERNRSLEQRLERIEQKIDLLMEKI